jgi:hypothetical protein
MTDHSFSKVPKGKNDEFIRSIKDKYSSFNKEARVSPNKFIAGTPSGSNQL